MVIGDPGMQTGGNVAPRWWGVVWGVLGKQERTPPHPHGGLVGPRGGVQK